MAVNQYLKLKPNQFVVGLKVYKSKKDTQGLEFLLMELPKWKYKTPIACYKIMKKMKNSLSKNITGFSNI